MLQDLVRDTFSRVMTSHIYGAVLCFLVMLLLPGFVILAPADGVRMYPTGWSIAASIWGGIFFLIGLVQARIALRAARRRSITSHHVAMSRWGDPREVLQSVNQELADPNQCLVIRPGDRTELLIVTPSWIIKVATQGVLLAPFTEIVEIRAHLTNTWPVRRALKSDITIRFRSGDSAVIFIERDTNFAKFWCECLLRRPQVFGKFLADDSTSASLREKGDSIGRDEALARVYDRLDEMRTTRPTRWCIGGEEEGKPGGADG